MTLTEAMERLRELSLPCREGRPTVDARDREALVMVLAALDGKLARATARAFWATVTIERALFFERNAARSPTVADQLLDVAARHRRWAAEG